MEIDAGEYGVEAAEEKQQPLGLLVTLLIIIIFISL